MPTANATTLRAVLAGLAVAAAGCKPGDGPGPQSFEPRPGLGAPHLESPGAQPPGPALPLVPPRLERREPPPAPTPPLPRKAVLAYPARLATAPGGAVCASDFEANAVVCGREEGSAPTLFDELTISNVDRPLGLAVHGERVYVGNLGRRAVDVYDARTGGLLFSLGRGRIEFLKPNAIAVAADGTAFVADSQADVVKVYEADGAFRKTLGGTGSGPGQLRFPSALALAGSTLVVADQGNHRLQVFGLDGTWLRTVGEAVPANARSVADFAGRFTRVQGLAVRGAQTLVLDSFHGHVQIFDDGWQSLGFFGRQGDCAECVALPLDIAVTSSGAVLAADPEHRRWTRLQGAPP